MSDEESRLAFVGHRDRLVDRVNGIKRIMRTNMYMFVPVKSWGFSWEEVQNTSSFMLDYDELRSD